MGNKYEDFDAETDITGPSSRPTEVTTRIIKITTNGTDNKTTTVREVIAIFTNKIPAPK